MGFPWRPEPEPSRVPVPPNAFRLTPFLRDGQAWVPLGACRFCYSCLPNIILPTCWCGSEGGQQDHSHSSYLVLPLSACLSLQTQVGRKRGSERVRNLPELVKRPSWNFNTALEKLVLFAFLLDLHLHGCGSSFQGAFCEGGWIHLTRKPHTQPGHGARARRRKIQLQLV